ncbi:hypothetical protein BHE74_00012872 [Ensete ventricosum]|uniref:Uncharacterized protein n=1 Tax=Ensete ventricosum TaxID=4639 RepID=A0A427BB44_ENSVE|nr:hypothetical protein B296_00004908 [Ensete ventricosum]RWW25276.1 hypothetical protein GW17_00010392 [Ensete ventricosum]RWW78884.1 hypothetical protein BHE74_00012872 [Ensete ventricosum]RZR83573.1 hypothetical protein BHM03_00010193 [Ensete ventricosum]
MIVEGVAAKEHHGRHLRFPLQLARRRPQYKVTVTGYVEPHKVVKRVQSTGKKAEIWPYVPYNVVARPYAAQTYDKKAPAGYVRNVEAIRVSSQVVKPEDQLASLFSDDNPNACSIM